MLCNGNNPRNWIYFLKISKYNVKADLLLRYKDIESPDGACASTCNGNNPRNQIFFKLLKKKYKDIESPDGAYELFHASTNISIAFYQNGDMSIAMISVTDE